MAGPTTLEIVSFPVEGMTCASCVNRITRFLAALEGVADANVNLATESATVRFDPDRIALPALGAAVEAAGYNARIEQVVEDAPAALATMAAARAERDAAAARHLAWLRRRLVVALILTAPLLAGLARMTVAPWLPGILAEPLVGLVLATPVQFWAGRPFYAGALAALRHRTTDMDVLIAAGTSAAYVYSLGTILDPAFFRAAGLGVGGAPLPLYFDTAATIITLILLGRYLEARARVHTADAIRALLTLSPRTARILDGEDERDVLVDTLRPGDLVRVRPGEALATDGVVVTGVSSVNESLLTGESAPVSKKIDDLVLGGTLNGAGSFTFRVTRVGADTVLARIVRLVAQAQGSRAPIARFADSVTGVFVPLVLALAALTFLIWLMIGPAPAFNLALLNAIAVLIIACPCALGLATPMAIMTGVGAGARAGILFRDATALERLGQARIMVLDKTGTLTVGRPDVTDIILAPGSPEVRTLLGLVAAAELGSEHPLGEAIVRHARSDLGLSLSEPSAFAAAAGAGVTASVDGHQVRVGRAGFLAAAGVDVSALAGAVDFLATDGKTPVLVALDGIAVATIAIAGRLNVGSRATVAALARRGIEVVMLTGDNALTAAAIAREAGITQVLADIRPAAKAAAVQTLQAQGKIVAMVGDGVNDAPALAAADIGVALGSGSDVAREAAGVTLLGGDLRKLVTALALSRATMANIRQNLVGAFAYNVILIPVAAGVLYPFSGILLDPIFAAGAMALSSLTVVANALRLRRFRVPALAD